MIFLLLLALSSIPLNASIEKQKIANAALAKAKKAFAETDRQAKELRGALESVNITDPKVVAPVSELYGILGYEVRRVPALYSVTVKNFHIATTGNGGDTDLATIGTTFAKAKKLKVISVAMEGTFSRYDDFKAFMHWFDQFPAAISNVDIKRNTYTLTLDLYGS